VVAVPPVAGSVDRGQARTIGLLLLTVVAIGLTVALAAFSFALTPSESEDVAMASVSVEIAEDEVVVIHDSGDSFDAEEIKLEINGGQRSIALNAFSSQPSDADRFAAGDRWTHGVTFTDDQVFVAVVHEPTGTVLASKRDSL
jgi:hypothetical protein